MRGAAGNGATAVGRGGRTSLSRGDAPVQSHCTSPGPPGPRLPHTKGLPSPAVVWCGPQGCVRGPTAVGNSSGSEARWALLHQCGVLLTPEELHTALCTQRGGPCRVGAGRGCGHPKTER